MTLNKSYKISLNLLTKATKIKKIMKIIMNKHNKPASIL